MKKFWKFHDKYYKILLLIPALLLLFSVAYLINFNSQNGDFIHKDISLKGGTVATIYEHVDLDDFETFLGENFEEFSIRQVYDVMTQEQKAIIIETTEDGEVTKQILEEYLEHELNSENSSFEFTGATLSESFYQQLLIAILVAFFFMGIVVFILFRTFVPSSAVIISAFADILMTLVFVDIIGMKLSSAGIVAFLMLIGYSVDTDILLTNKILKSSRGSVNEKITRAFKTGITMTLTSLLAMGFALFIVSSFSITLTQIFSILVIGLGFDIMNTWITNVSILKWYAEVKGI